MRGYASPNCGPRRDGLQPELVVIHYTAMADFAVARARLCDPVAEVSAHWLIDRDGRAEQLVDEGLRAWHAGAGSWGGQGDVNSRSIGIELVNRCDEPFPEPQFRALEVLLGAILTRWQIPPQAVIGHSDMAPARKSDPGPRFDWQRLARGGLSVWPEVAREAVSEIATEDLVQPLARFGYPAEAPPEALLRAFRLRFRPAALGLPADTLDLALAEDLATRFPHTLSR